MQDGNHWVNELARSSAVVDFWPVNAAPSDLDRLNEAPREAFPGQSGAVRRVPRRLPAHRVTPSEMTELVLDAGDCAAELTAA